MVEERVQRRLAAILAADVVGYSSLIRADEEGTLARLKSLRRDIIDPKIAAHNGRIVKTTGDGLLIEFASAVDAVRHAIEVQQAVRQHQAEVPGSQNIVFRVGINLGDVVIDGDDIQGDGVNVAARLEALAAPGCICISGKVYEEVRDRVDATFEDKGEQKFKNIDRPVSVWQWGAAAQVMTAVSGIPDTSQPQADKPTVAILPFDNMSGDADQEYFADGMTEDLITELSRFRSLVVIASKSTFVYKSRSANISQIRQELGARYIVEGSVRRSNSRVRVTAQLVDAQTGKHLWAERYDRSSADIFAVQDEVTESIASTLMVQLEDAEHRRSLRSTPNELSAYDCWLRARCLLHKGSKNELLEARALLERAIELEHNYAAAYVELSESYFLECYSPWTTSPQAAAQKVLEYARIAAELDPYDSRAHLALSWAHLVIGWDFDLAKMRIEEALRLNPNDYNNYCFKGWLLTCAGELQDAVACSNEAFRRSPLVPDDCLLSRLAAEYLAGNYVDAIAAFGKMLKPDPHCFAWVAAAYAQLGRTEEARVSLEEFYRRVRALPEAPERLDRKGWISYWSTVFPSKNPAAQEHLFDGLRKAGLSV